jgi:hypothetical protein
MIDITPDLKAKIDEYKKVVDVHTHNGGSCGGGACGGGGGSCGGGACGGGNYSNNLRTYQTPLNIKS